MPRPCACAIARVRPSMRIGRRLESVPRCRSGFDTTPLSGGNRGTGSARRRSNDAVGIAQMTPPPDPRRTDREALARRRTAQLEAALMLARTLLGQRKLDEALDACQQALTPDETHTGALELEEEIQTALRIREGVDIAADDSVDSALTTAAEPSSFHPGLTPSRFLESQAVTRAHEQAFVVTGLPPASSERPLTATVPPSAVADGCSANTTSSGSRGRRSRTSRVGANEMGRVRPSQPLPLPRLPRSCSPAVLRRPEWQSSTRRLGEHHRDSERGRRLAAAAVTAVHAGVTGIARRHVSISLAGPPPQSKKETVTLRVNAGQTSVAPVTRSSR